ncbi:DUF2141 domain-containing protein [Antarcticibacterium flavum]|uniref:DUF2141 domain-containing protein n=1 Tax=Antarcticibacterium flavum TaxID=2058175 RepID=A0A5B7X2S4_9FLAO|nr:MULTISPECIES: DUF2141 domain-containing protein [Antarcticibacterium]MCM4159915.1 hypothetical protein [Antarcticibacterium sp. W02-3]QCY68913.1 DUF2141 domain-containing protein [Antarcticibacterium flavum]
MKNLKSSLLIFLFGTFLTNAQNTIEVEITNFDNNTGVAFIGLYNSEGAFLKTLYKGEKAEIKNRKVVLTFEDIPNGTYAISAFHDADENGELTTNFIGIPKEKYGASNNAPSRFGPPKWKDARFEVRNGETVYQKIEL